MMSDDRAAVYLEGGTAVYRASSVGICSRALIALRMGFTEMAVPEWLEERFQQGHDLEDQILAEYEDVFSTKLVDRQGEVEIAVGTSAVIRGHFDGRDDEWVVDGKAFAQSTWDGYMRGGIEAYPYYRDQMTIYMVGTGLKGCMAIYNKDTDQYYFDVFDEPPGDIDEIKKKVMVVEVAGRKGKLPDGCDTKTWPCPVFYIHEDDTVEVDDGLALKLEGLARAYDDARDLESRGKTMKKEASKEMLGLLKDAGVDKTETDSFKLTVVDNPGRPRIDRKLLEEAGIDPEPFTVRTPYSYPKVTAKKVEGGV